MREEREASACCFEEPGRQEAAEEQKRTSKDVAGNRLEAMERQMEEEERMRRNAAGSGQGGNRQAGVGRTRSGAGSRVTGSSAGSRISGGGAGSRVTGSRISAGGTGSRVTGSSAGSRISAGGTGSRAAGGTRAYGSGAGSRTAGGGAGSRSGRARGTAGGNTRNAGKAAGSRYAEKQSIASGYAGGAGRRTGRRKRRRSRQAGSILLLILLVLAAVCLAGVYVLAQKKQKEQRAEENAQAQISVNLEELDSPYAILLDGASGTVLATKRGDEKIYPASMAKIMTVLTAIELIRDLDGTVTMSYDIYDDLYARDASRAGFEPGEEARIRDLLYGALLPSGAECCVQLALEAAGSESAFAEQMNQKAADLGLTQTHFANATGLHSEEQYSTPHEIGAILQAALQNKTFYEVFTTHHYTVQASSVHPDGFTFWSSMFKSMEDDTVNGGKIMGGKTGYTDEAGHCLASMAEINGRAYILVTAGWAQNAENAQYHISDAFRAYNQIAN